MKKSSQNKEIVYLLDDDPVFSYALELWFEVQGYRIKTFSNAYSFLEGLKQCKPDIVILDFAINDDYEGIKTGADVAKRLSETYNNLPVVMLSAQENIQIAVDLFAMQIVDYVIKDDDLHLKLEQILKHLREMTVLKEEIKKIKMQSKLRFKRTFVVIGCVILFWLTYILF